MWERAGARSSVKDTLHDTAWPHRARKGFHRRSSVPPMSAPTAHRRLALLSRHLSAAKVRSGVAVMSTTSSAPPSPSSAASAAADDPRKPVCLVVGGGAGIGQSVAKKFASEGYHACVVRRGSGPHRLMEGDGDMPAFIASLEEAGGSGECFFADGTKEDEVSHLVKTIEEDGASTGCEIVGCRAGWWEEGVGVG